MEGLMDVDRAREPSSHQSRGRAALVRIIKDAEPTLAFLLRATAILHGEPLSYRDRLEQLARIVVPDFGDWCTIDVLEDDRTLSNVAIAHVDPHKVSLARELRRRYPPDPNAPRGVFHVIETGMSELVPEVSLEILAGAARDEEHFRILRALCLKSYLCVPLAVGAQIFGALSVVAAESGRRFGPESLAVAEELAHRAAVAIHTARLYQGLEFAKRELDHSLQTIRGLTEELEQRVQLRTAELTAANRELEAFSHSVSHDLRAPLRAIDGFSQALLEEYAERLDDRGKAYLGRVRAGAQRMAHLIDDLLKLSQRTRRELSFETVDLTEAARAIAEELRDREPLREIEVKIEEGLTAVGDPHLLRIALENLLSNAWKFTREQSSARIEVGMTVGEEPTFFVRDNGVGFDMAYVGKLFQPFQRLHVDSAFEGTGIGLATVQRVVHRHGGRIWAEGREGAGAAIYFTLPQARKGAR